MWVLPSEGGTFLGPPPTASRPPPPEGGGHRCSHLVSSGWRGHVLGPPRPLRGHLPLRGARSWGPLRPLRGHLPLKGEDIVVLRVRPLQGEEHASQPGGNLDPPPEGGGHRCSHLKSSGWWNARLLRGLRQGASGPRSGSAPQGTTEAPAGRPRGTRGSRRLGRRLRRSTRPAPGKDPVSPPWRRGRRALRAGPGARGAGGGLLRCGGRSRSGCRSGGGRCRLPCRRGGRDR